MIVSIVVGSTFKGLVTGALAGFIARGVQSVPIGVLAGAAIGFAALFSALSDARQAADPFERVSFMIGRWESTIEGQPGKGIGRREYSRMLNNRFIRIVNRSEYAPQEKNPKGEIHEDEGFFSF
jgi:hypothetical protein